MDSDGAVPFVESGDQVMLLDSSGREGRLANMAAHAWSEECEIGVDGQGVIWLAGERPARAIEPGPRVLLSSLASANGVYAALGLVAEAAALLVNCESGEVERYELGGSMVQPIGGPPDLGPVSRTNHPEAVAIDDSGNLAISVDDGRIYIVNR
jgi:hypothetical protein